MTQNDVEEAMDIAEEKGLEVHEYEHGGYSGRDMYGETTEAVIVEYVDLATLQLSLEERGITVRVDNMGLDYVIY